MCVCYLLENHLPLILVSYSRKKVSQQYSFFSPLKNLTPKLSGLFLNFQKYTPP